MLFLKESNYESFQGENGKGLTNCFVYILSEKLEIKDTDGIAVGISKLTSIRPSQGLIKAYKAGEINEGKFKAEYKKELKSYESMLIIYMIVRSIGEKHCLPVFVTTDDDAELGFIEVLEKLLKKKFGIKALKVKKYKKTIKAIFKAAKREAGKKKKVLKTAKKLLRANVADSLQLSSDGYKLFEKLDKKFSIDRIVICINQNDSDDDEIGKKVIVPIIKSYADSGRKQYKIVKASVDALDISKKSDRWSRKDAVNLAIQIYNTIHEQTDTSPSKK